MQSNNNILIAQGGGPTNVINQSLVGIINGEKSKNSNIIGAINGVRGIIDNKFINLSKFNSVNLKKIQNTPGAALGSTRDKPDEKYCHEILKILNKTEIILAYNVVPETERFLEVGKSADVRVDLLSIPGGYSTVNIYSESQLTYEYSAEDNVVIVIVKPGSEGSDHKSVYISPTGRIYSF